MVRWRACFMRKKTKFYIFTGLYVSNTSGFMLEQSSVTHLYSYWLSKYFSEYWIWSTGIFNGFSQEIGVCNGNRYFFQTIKSIWSTFFAKKTLQQQHCLCCSFLFENVLRLFWRFAFLFWQFSLAAKKAHVGIEIECVFSTLRLDVGLFAVKRWK